MKTNQIFSRYLDTVGDGTGTKNARGDYSSSEGVFKITANASAKGSLFISRMIVFIRDSGVMAAGGYGSIAAPGLTNGITVEILDENDDTVRELTDGIAIQSNAGWGRQCFDVARKAWGAGDEIMLVRYSFFRTGQYLHLPPGYSLAVKLNDNLSALIEHTFLVQGHEGKDPRFQAMG